MPGWMVIALAAATAAAWIMSKRSNSPSTGGGIARRGLRGTAGPGRAPAAFRVPPGPAPTTLFARSSGPSADALRDADRMGAANRLDEQRAADFSLDQELQEERAWHAEQQRIDDDYISSGGYY